LEYAIRGAFITHWRSKGLKEPENPFKKRTILYVSCKCDDNIKTVL
jgi:hypothetical protein